MRKINLALALMSTMVAFIPQGLCSCVTLFRFGDQNMMGLWSIMSMRGGIRLKQENLHREQVMWDATLGNPIRAGYGQSAHI